MHICYSAPRRRRVMEHKLEWPITRQQLYKCGWTREMQIERRKCKRCPKTIEFWRTPDQKLHPIEERPDGQLVSHFSTCPNAGEFRNRAKLKVEQGELFG